MEQLCKTTDAKQQAPKAYFLVMEHIETLIQGGNLTFGAKLPSERQLMATLGLSRNSVREALRSLENLGILESRHGQGSFLVNHMEESLGSMFSLLLSLHACSYQEISQLRRSIEIGAYLLAVKRPQDMNLRPLFDILSQMETCSEKERAKWDKNFHDTLIALSQNRLMQLLNQTLSPLFESSIQQMTSRIALPQWQTLVSYHRETVCCLSKRSEPEGIAAITRHYDYIDGYFCRLQQPDSQQPHPSIGM